MASPNIPKIPPTSKQLGQLLQEQQEPFLLEVFLLERGYLKRSLSKPGSDPKNSRNCILQCSCKVLRALLHKVVTASDQKQRKRDYGCIERTLCSIKRGGGRSQEVAESDKFSSASSTTVYNSCSSSDAEDASEGFQVSTPEEGEVKGEIVAADTERKSGGGLCTVTEDAKQLSPVSVLEDVSSEECSPSDETIKRPGLKQPVDTATLAYLLESFHQTGAELQELGGIHFPLHDNIKPRGVLIQTQFHCVRGEWGIDRSRKKQRGHSSKVLPSRKTWARHQRDEGSMTQLLHLEVSAATEEDWTGFEEQYWELGAHLGNLIFEEMISSELVIS